MIRYNIDIVRNEKITSLDELMDFKKNIKGIEGWVVKFTNGKSVKVKTDEYNLRHYNFQTAHGLTENLIIKHVMDETIDNIIRLVDDIEKKKNNKKHRRKGIDILFLPRK